MTHYSFFEGKIITFIFIKMMSRDLLVQMAYSKNYCHFTGHKTWQGQLYCYQAVHFSILVLKTNMKANYISVLFSSDIAIRAFLTVLQRPVKNQGWILMEGSI